jgi:hypothetical protein
MAGVLDFVPYGSLFTGLLNTYEGFKGLSDLNSTPVPKFNETPEQMASRFRAEELAKSGYTAEEKANFDQKLQRSENTAYQRNLAVAPSLAQATLAGINYTNTGAMNQFAANDADLHRENIKYADTFSKYLQELNNKNTEAQLQQRLMAEQALGQAAQSGISQIGTAANYLNFGGKSGMNGENLQILSGEGNNMPQQEVGKQFDASAIPSRYASAYSGTQSPSNFYDLPKDPNRLNPLSPLDPWADFTDLYNTNYGKYK